MKHFCIIVNQSKEEGLEKAKHLADIIEDKGGFAQILPTRKEGELTGEGFTDLSGLDQKVEAALVLGGDGTVIQAARELSAYNLPIMGINLGTMGFLTTVEIDQMEQAMDLLFEDQFHLEERVMMSGAVIKGGQAVYWSHALNDIVITRSGYSRIITVQVSVNGQKWADYRGDGVILSTPTGSTAYNMSAGGPVILPEAQAFAITPICAHSTESRGVVTSSRDAIRVEITHSKKTQTEEAIVSFDGNNGIPLETGDVVEVRQADQQIRFIKFEARGLLDNLRDKIRSVHQESEV